MTKDQLLSITCTVTGAVVGLWTGLNATVQLFLMMILFDIVTGVLASFKQGHGLDSSICGDGLLKKAGYLVAVGFLTVIGDNPRVSMPLGELSAGAFAANEALSVVENLANINVDVKKFLGRFLAQTQTDKADGSKPNDQTA